MNNPVLTPSQCLSLIGCQVLLFGQKAYIQNVEHTTLLDGSLFTFVDEDNVVLHKLYEVEFDFDDIFTLSMYPSEADDVYCTLHTYLTEITTL